MDPLKSQRWKQRFENFEKAYLVLEKYEHQSINNELERAGLIQLFEVTFELAWKVLKDYIESEGYIVRSSRETIKTAFQMEIIEDGHIWIDALSNRNLAAHTYNEVMAIKFTKEIKDKYFPQLRKLYEKLSKERL
ncbi:nucleotidyltransferase substrate binding protein (TIGR01987 family) [Scopulibacillus darangshiensis]|uniref:Nucleotidyltransferase substrate binding protein (TIGR01987 family) n=1 Tax=Scopulibacillus darangshiensis TaxID=442528 RepID=A0A4R2P6V2_9BACL|nr:nucleotidyltransferase substrate binding protein [Scopulibacillus darangshiensis]TCP29721.1 nucleotidyltransferase substrate binding protein (TIGR01987 family) [Scopulibacillus darangshiensis]